MFTLLLYAADTAPSTGISTTDMIISFVKSIAGVASSGWAGVAAMSLASIIGLVAAIFGTRFLANYIKNKTYKNDLDLSNSSAGKEAVEAAKAEEAAKQQLQNSMNQIHQELDEMSKPKPEKK